MHIEDNKLKDFIIDSGLVSKADLALAVAEAKKSSQSLSQVLISQGKMRETDVRQMEAYLLGIPFISLVGDRLDFDVLSLIPEPIARAHNIIAFKKNDNTSLEVAMLDTEDLPAIEFIKKKVGLKILPRLTDNESIKSALLQYQKSLKEEFGNLISKESSDIKVLSDELKKSAGEKDLKKMAEDIPAIKIVDALLKHALLQDASDIHIEPQEKVLLVRYRIDGLLHDAMTLPQEAEAAIIARIKVLSNLKLDEKRLPQDGRFKIESDGQKLSLRVSVLPTYYGEKIVMRLLRENAHGFTLDYLGFHGENLERLHAATKLSVGMILATGPTGSGKSTTLYTILEILNTPNVNISTIEDPIEYQMPRVNQTQVRPEIGFSFADGLRTLVRQDPDIVMVGEIRDDETANLAINAALTGHLVLSTLHTNSAAGAMPRLLDMKVEPFLLVSTLSVIIGQRLVRRLSESRERRALSASELTALGKLVDLDRILSILRNEKIIGDKDDWKKVLFGVPKPTPDVPDGYKGRIGIHEVLTMSSTIRDLVMKGANSSQIEAQAKKEGMMTMIEDGIFKAAQGITTVEEVLRVVSE